MKRSALRGVTIFAVALYCAPAHASTLTPVEAKWALHARAVWRAYRLDWDSKAKMRKAEPVAHPATK